MLYFSKITGEDDLDRLPDDYKNTTTSHATLRLQDLVEKHLDFISDNVPESHLHPDYQDWIEVFDKYQGNPYDDKSQEALQWVWDEIFDYLNDIAPDGCVFSSHIGVDELFGFWDFPG